MPVPAGTDLHRLLVRSHDSPAVHRFIYASFACSLALLMQILACGCNRWTDVLAGPSVALLCLSTLVVRWQFLPRQVFVSSVLCVWGCRLTCLYATRPRIHVGVSPSAASLCVARTLWAWAVSTPAVLLNTLDHSAASSRPFPSTALDVTGAAFALAGVTLEAVADSQKLAWHRARAAQADQATTCLQTGLWAWSRHPNYFGQLLMHLGLYAVASAHAPVWSAAGFAVSAISILLMEGSMVTLEQAKNMKFFGKPAYLLYRQQTSPLVPLPPWVYRRLPWWIKKTCLLEWDVYAVKSISRREDAIVI